MNNFVRSHNICTDATKNRSSHNLGNYCACARTVADPSIALTTQSTASRTNGNGAQTNNKRKPYAVNKQN